MQRKLFYVAAGFGALYLLSGRKSPDASISVAENDASVDTTVSNFNAEVTPVNNQTPVIDKTDVNRNVSAFLYMIRASEHLFPQNVENNACYGIFYKGARFSDFSDHPVITGELKGVPLADSVCHAAGLSSGCVSTAAGAYQLIKPTWQRIRNKGAYLADFSPENQDIAAVRLLDEAGALSLIQAGDINGAIRKASKIWASLPYSSAQQNPKTLAYALDRFADGLSLA